MHTLRGIFMSVANRGIGISDIESIITAAKTFVNRNVVMPKCMYGAELWHGLVGQLHAR